MVFQFFTSSNSIPLILSSLRMLLDPGAAQHYGKGSGSNWSGLPCHRSLQLQSPLKSCSLLSWPQAHGGTFGPERPFSVIPIMKLYLSVINTSCCKESYLAHMMRCLFFIEAKFNFIITAKHITGKSNTNVDNLSRGDSQSFLSSHPQASRLPTPLEPGLINSLTVVTPDWMSPSWIQSFTASFSKH